MSNSGRNECCQICKQLLRSLCGCLGCSTCGSCGTFELICSTCSWTILVIQLSTSSWPYKTLSWAKGYWSQPWHIAFIWQYFQSVYQSRKQLNALKCVKISFLRSKSCEHFDYTIYGIEVSGREVVRDLSILLNFSHTADHHVEAVCNRAIIPEGFLWIGGNCGLFLISVVTLSSPVRTILEYACLGGMEAWLCKTHCKAGEDLKNIRGADGN